MGPTPSLQAGTEESTQSHTADIYKNHAHQRYMDVVAWGRRLMRRSNTRPDTEEGRASTERITTPGNMPDDEFETYTETHATDREHDVRVQQGTAERRRLVHEQQQAAGAGVNVDGTALSRRPESRTYPHASLDSLQTVSDREREEIWKKTPVRQSPWNPLSTEDEHERTDYAAGDRYRVRLPLEPVTHFKSQPAEFDGGAAGAAGNTHRRSVLMPDRQSDWTSEQKRVWGDAVAVLPREQRKSDGFIDFNAGAREESQHSSRPPDTIMSKLTERLQRATKGVTIGSPGTRDIRQNFEKLSSWWHSNQQQTSNEHTPRVSEPAHIPGSRRPSHVTGVVDESGTSSDTGPEGPGYVVADTSPVCRGVCVDPCWSADASPHDECRKEMDAALYSMRLAHRERDAHLYRRINPVPARRHPAVCESRPDECPECFDETHGVSVKCGAPNPFLIAL